MGVVRRIMEEDAAEMAARIAKQEETRQYIDKFMVDREEWKQQQQRQVEEENRKIQEYAAKVQQRQEEERLKAQSKSDEQDRILARITDEINRKAQEQAELEELRVELEVQEVEEKVLEKERAMMEKRIRDRLEMMQANEYQKQLKSLKRYEEKQEEEEFRSKMMAKFAEEDRIEQMNAQKRRMKLQEHLEAVRVEEMKRQIIEEERQRMLAQHAANLGLEHLPKGVLARDEDR